MLTKEDNLKKMLDTEYKYRISVCNECDTDFAGLIEDPDGFKCVVCGTIYAEDTSGIYNVVEADDAYRIYVASIKPNLERD